jgi:hypothetical protein
MPVLPDAASTLNGKTVGFNGLNTSICKPAANRQSSLRNSPNALIGKTP